MIWLVQGSEAIMPSQHDQPTSTPAFGAIVTRMAAAVFMQASLVLLVCAVLAEVTEKGSAPFAAASSLAFGFSSSIALGRGLRAEYEKIFDGAGHLYALALVNYVTSYASFLLLGLRGSPAIPDRPPISPETGTSQDAWREAG
jgi:hypothetical protein